MNANGLCSIKYFCDRFGIKGENRIERTRRQLKSLEAKFEVRILISFGGKGKGARYMVDLPKLKETVPAVFSDGLADVEVLKKDMGILKETVRSCVSKVRKLNDRVTSLEEKPPEPSPETKKSSSESA